MPTRLTVGGKPLRLCELGLSEWGGVILKGTPLCYGLVHQNFIIASNSVASYFDTKFNIC